MTAPHERTIRKFNPGTFQSDEEVIEQFVVRKHELQIVMDTLRRNIEAQSCQHLLIVAPRGRGKTMLLARSAAEIRTNEELANRLVPIRFMEESHEIFTIGDFWMEALFQLANEIRGNHANIADELSKTHADLTSQWQNRDVAERARATVLDTTDRLDRHLVVIAENLQSLSSDVDENFGWSLRQALQTEPKITLLATATSRFRGLDDPDQPFYELFRVVHLDPLDTAACGHLMQALTGEAREDIEALRILTGGDPRLLVLIADFFLHRSFGELMQELVRLIDDHTEYFRSHLDSLPKTERRVYVALIDLWQPSTAGEIAARARMDIRKVSALLGRLVERGAISASGRGNRRHYAATQRLYSIYYKLRRERNEAALVRSLVRFMVFFFRAEEVTDILHKAQADRALSPIAMREFERAMAEKSTSETEAADMPLAKGVDRVQASEADELVRRLGDRDDPDLRLQLAKALFNKGLALGRLDQPQAAVGTFDELLRRFGDSDDPQLRLPVAKALVNKGVTLGQTNQPDAAVDAYGELARRFGDSDDPDLRSLVARALVNKGVTLDQANQPGAAVDAYDELARRFGQSDDPDLRLQLAKALVNKGLALGRMDQPQAAVGTFDELVRRFGDSDDPDLRLQLAKALVNKAVALGRMDQLQAEVGTYDELARRFGQSDDPDLRLPVAKALVNKGLTLHQMEQPDAAVDAYDELLRRFGDNDDPDLRLPVAKALFNKGVTLGQLEQPQAEVGTYDELARRFGDSDDPDLRLPVAKALVNKAVTLGRLDQPQAAVGTFDELVRRFADSDDPDLRLPVARALFNRGLALDQLDQPQAEVGTYDELVRRFGDSDDPDLRLQVAKTLFNKGVTLAQMDQPDAAVDAYDELARRFGDSDDPDLRLQVAKALLGKGEIHAQRDEFNEMVTVCAEMIHRFRDGEEEILNMTNAMFKIMVDTIASRGAEQPVSYLLSQNARTAAALWPLDVALRQYLGEDVRAPAEVMEVAQHALERMHSAKE